MSIQISFDALYTVSSILNQNLIKTFSFVYYLKGGKKSVIQSYAT